MSGRALMFAPPETLYRIYYECFEVGNPELREIFGGRAGKSKLWQIKKDVKKLMVEKEIMPIFASNVNTKVLYEYLGLDIDDIERRVKKLRKFAAG